MIRWFLALPLKLLYSFLHLLSGSKPYRSLSPQESARRYIDALESLHESEHLPLLTTSYARAVEEAKRELKFLLVIITSSQHGETAACQDGILCSSALRTFVQDHGMLCWAGDAVEVEGFQVAHALGATRFPLFVVLVYNTLRSPASVSCVTKIEGLVDVAGLIDMLTTALDRYEPTLIAARLDRREQTASREIRKEQDSAYERSLAADRRRAEEARLAEEIRAREIAEAEESARQQLLYRAWRHARLLPEPDAGANAQVARVSFRMPDGTRVVRKFDAACMIEELYAFVDAKLNPLSDEERNRAGEVTDQPAQAYQYTFTLAVPMPRTVITCSKESKIADRKEVSPSGSLIVEPLEDEEMIA